MILHVDMDAFYAAIEQRDDPKLRGRPVVVGGNSGRGVVSAASYEARRFGIHSAMSGKRARELCPEAIFVKTRMDHYVHVGRQVREVFERFTPIVQPISIDEAFLDVSGSLRLFGSAEKIGRQIKAIVREELNLTASVGIAPLKFVAKIASDLNKPDGFLMVAPNAIIPFLDPLPVSKLWGVGKVGQEKLERLGLLRMVDIRSRQCEWMEQQFGAWGIHLWKLANGKDGRQVVVDRQAKQISHERTFAEDIADASLLEAVLSHLSEQVCRRLRRNQRTCRNVSIKYRREDFRTFSRSATLTTPSDSTDEVFQMARQLLREMRQREPRPVRLLGISIASLSDPNSHRQLSLFHDQDTPEKMNKIDQIMDDIHDRMGINGLYRGSGHEHVGRKPLKKATPSKDVSNGEYEPPPEEW